MEDTDVDFEILVERGSTGQSLESDPGDDAGERMLAAQSRIKGREALAAALAAVGDAARAAGWDGGFAPCSVVRPAEAGGDELGGRAPSLFTGIADGVLRFPGACPERFASMCTYRGLGGGKVAAHAGKDRTAVAVVRYLSSGPNADADGELRDALHDSGFEVLQ